MQPAASLVITTFADPDPNSLSDRIRVHVAELVLDVGPGSLVKARVVDPDLRLAGSELFKRPDPSPC